MKELVFNFLGEKPLTGAIVSFGGGVAGMTFSGFVGLASSLIGLAVGSITLAILWNNVGGIKGLWKILKNWKQGKNTPPQ